MIHHSCGLSGCPNTFLSAMQLSAAVLLQVVPYTSDPLVLLERAIAILIYGSMLLALRRRLERKMRK